MSTLELQHIYNRGYVKFIVTGAPAGYTVKRATADGLRLIGIPGYETDEWHQPGGSGYGEDYRCPLGETVTYVLAPFAQTANDPAYTQAAVDVPGNVAWLRDVTYPVYSRSVVVVTTNTENEPVRHFIYSISGRRLPLVVYDVREGRNGTVQLLVRDALERLRLEEMLATGRPLLLTMCSDKMWAPCMMAIGNAAFTRYGTGSMWTLDLEYNEVEDPWVGAAQRDVAPTWRTLRDNPVGITWQQIKDDYASWLRVATGQPS